MARNCQFRRDFGQRHQHEGTLVQVRMRHLQPRLVERLRAIQQQVQVQRARAPVHCRITRATEALLVDQLIGQHQVVVKNLESNYRKVPGISAATILGDGSVALIVDVSALQGLNREQRVAASAA